MTQEEGLNPDIALTFFAVFHGFENALKKAGYLRAGRPDWERFVQVIEEHFAPEASPELLGAVMCLLDMHAKRLRHNSVTRALRDVGLLSAVIREIGNDLSRNMTHRRYTAEDDEAMYACTLILDAWSELEPNVKRVLS